MNTAKTVKQDVETKDLYQQITDQIVESMSQSTDWVMPWHGKANGLPKNVATQKAYAGVNTLVLWQAAYVNGYKSCFWGTYKQWKDLGAQVRKGEKARTIVFYKDLPQSEQADETGATLVEQKSKRFVLKASTVFNAEQVEGFEIPQEETTKVQNQLEKVEDFILKTGAKITHGSASAFYQVSADLIVMPEQSSFVGTKTSTAPEAYYATILHELAHWTGHKSRLDRILPTSRFGSDSYAMEELIAELTSAFLCAELGVSTAPRQDHANYIANWLNVINNDKRAIFFAARQATLAANYLNGLTQETQELL